MRWTNNYNLPERVINVIKGGRKDKRPDIGRLSITDLIDEPLPRILYINHYDDIVRDYSDLLQATMGTALHTRYETFATEDDDEAEVKFEDAVNDMIVVGKADNYMDDGTILDLKTVNVYGPKYKIDKYTKQLNCYAWQRRKRGFDVNKLIVDVWYRNWTLSNIHYKEYPQILYEQIEIPLWSFEEQDEYIRNQVEYHLSFNIEKYPEDYKANCFNCCPDKVRGIRYEAYKKGNKTPTKVEDTKEALELWASKQKFDVEIRKSDPVFCINYCRSRSICPFAKEE